MSYNITDGGAGCAIKRLSEDELKEHRRQYYKKWCEENKEELKAYKREYAKQHREEYRAYNKK